MSLTKLGMEGNFFNVVKDIIKKKIPTANSRLNNNKYDACPLKSTTRQVYLLSLLLFNILLKVLASRI